MPRIPLDRFQRERKTGAYRRIDGVLELYAKDATGARLFVTSERGLDTEEHEIDGTPFITDIDEGVYDGREVTVLANTSTNGNQTLGKYIMIKSAKRGREPECFEGCDIVVLPPDNQ
jgi:hypothetical protein